jgi:hypothetical protein
MIDLYMDDVRTCPYIGWVTVRTIEEAKEWLKTGMVDDMSLDHDMGACAACITRKLDVGDMRTPETTFVSWCTHSADGTSLVRWMVETGHWSKKKPTVHSANPYGAMRMRDMIDRYWTPR